MSLSTAAGARPYETAARGNAIAMEAVDILRGKDTIPASGQYIRTTNRTVIFGFANDSRVRAYPPEV